MNIVLIGTRWFGAQVLELLLDRDDSISVIATNGEDTLAKAAVRAHLPLTALDNPRKVSAEHIPDDTDLIITAHCHAFITKAAREKARIGAIGYHPSLLPRHRGVAAVEWTIRCRDPIAGGSIYMLGDGWDDGLILKQDWCFVYPDDDAGSLWKRELAPMGLRLLIETVHEIASLGTVPKGKVQDDRAATLALA